MSITRLGAAETDKFEARDLQLNETAEMKYGQSKGAVREALSKFE